MLDPPVAVALALALILAAGLSGCVVIGRTDGSYCAIAGPPLEPGVQIRCVYP